MLPKLPGVGGIEKIAAQLPVAEFRMPKSREEKVEEIKKRFNLTHGKGKRKKSKKKG